MTETPGGPATGRASHDGAAKVGARVADVMQRVFTSVRPVEQMDLVHDVMALGQIRHLPVVEHGRLVGIVSQRDLLATGLSSVLEFAERSRRDFLRTVAIQDVMTHDVQVIDVDAPLAEAGHRMVAGRFGCLPVVDADGVLVGMLTETDLVRAAYGPEKGAAPPPD